MFKSRFNLIMDMDKGDKSSMKSEEVTEQEPKEGNRCISKSEISVRLSFLGKTANGDGYTYLKADLTGMGLMSIQAIKYFKYLQFLDVSRNNIQLSELQVITELPHLVLIQADKNGLESAALRTMLYMQVIIMNNNEITTVQDVFQPELSTLEMGFNKIQEIQFNKPMPTIKCLDFRNNQISNISGLDFPMLYSLYLASNKIPSLVGLEKLVNLRILHVRDNPIESLDGFHKDLTKLIYINLRDCEIEQLKQIKKLQVLKGIETLILKGCPYMGGKAYANSPDYVDDPETRVEILAVLPKLIRINKDIVTSDEIDEAKELMLQLLDEDDSDESEA